MTRFLPGVVAVALALPAGAALADDVKNAEKKLATARDVFSTAMAGVRDDVLKLIDDRDGAERKRANPDLAKLKALKAEKEALEKDGEMPKWVDVKTKDRITKARKQLLDALREAKAAYVRAKEDDKAEDIEKEIGAVNKGASFPAAGAAITFKKGDVWEGSRVSQNPENGGETQTYRFEITSSDGNKFKAKFWLSDVAKKLVTKDDWTIAGTLAGDRIVYEETGNNNYRMTVVGTLKANKITYKFSGTRADGGKRSGEGEVMLKKEVGTKK